MALLAATNVGCEVRRATAPARGIGYNSTMIRKILLPALIVFAAIVGAGVALRLQGSALPGLPLPKLPESLDAAARANDSTAVADMAVKRCRLLVATSQRKCYEDFLLDLVEKDQVHLAIGALALLGQRDDYIRRFGHDYAHVIGINAWKPGKDIGKVYAQCSELFQSGCYHGVIQAVFAYQGTDSASVAALCQSTPEINASAWLRFQCVHGIGHGLLQTYTMNLPKALHGCDMLGNAWDSESCYGGAFMEFIVGGRGQSHHVHLAEAAKADTGEHAGHDMAGMNHDHPEGPDSAWPAFKVRNPTDPLYPCTALGERYQRACYQMQAGLVAEITGLDFKQIAQACDRAPERWRTWCYQGIGTYVSGVTVRVPERGIAECSLGDPKYQPWCFVGLVKNFVDVTANLDDGLDFCKRLLGTQSIAVACYVALGEQAAVLWPSMEKRRTECARSEPQYAEACDYGAGLTFQKPAGYEPRP